MNLTVDIINDTVFVPYKDSEKTTAVLATALYGEVNANSKHTFVCAMPDDTIYYNLIIAAPLVVRALKEAIETLQSVAKLLYYTGDVKSYEVFTRKIEGLQLAYDAAFEGVAKITRKMQQDEISKKL